MAATRAEVPSPLGAAVRAEHGVCFLRLNKSELSGRRPLGPVALVSLTRNLPLPSRQIKRRGGRVSPQNALLLSFRVRAWLEQNGDARQVASMTYIVNTFIYSGCACGCWKGTPRRSTGNDPESAQSFAEIDPNPFANRRPPQRHWKEAISTCQKAGSVALARPSRNLPPQVTGSSGEAEQPDHKAHFSDRSGSSMRHCCLRIMRMNSKPLIVAEAVSAPSFLRGKANEQNSYRPSGKSRQSNSIAACAALEST